MLALVFVVEKEAGRKGKSLPMGSGHVGEGWTSAPGSPSALFWWSRSRPEDAQQHFRGTTAADTATDASFVERSTKNV